MATLDVSTSADQGFGEWLAAASGDFSLDVAIKYENGQWFALLAQFDITGAGPTKHAAIRDAFGLLFAYLHAYYEDGAPFSDAIRPIPVSLKARIIAESALGRIVRRMPVRTTLATESHYALPPGVLPDLARC